MVIGIIGGGASGMAAALSAAKNPNVQVLVFERQARVGKKLLATGNGRCNLTNLHALEGGYFGEEADFAKPALERYSPTETLAWFRSLGLFTVAEQSGRVYPYSDQANSVVDVLRLAMEKENIRLYTGFEVQKGRRKGHVFCINEEIECDKLIIACGGLAGTKLGGSMAGYKLLSKFGHRSTRLRPALVQIKCNWHGSAALKGVRAECGVSIYHDEKLVKQGRGEIQFTEMGLSGPVMFELSRDVCATPGHWVAQLDLLPDYTAEDLQVELLRRRNTNLPIEELLTGVLHNRLGRVLVKSAGIKNRKTANELTDGEIADICQTVKSCQITLTEPLGMDAAQVTAGGVLTCDFDPNTMESKLVPGLYACGEVLDIDGDCGGYNLQWAWSSGRLAGENAGKE